MSDVCLSMALELENNDKKKVFARWKENLRDFFIEDEKIDKSLIDKETETLIDDNLKTEDTEKEDEVIEKAEEILIEHICTSTTNGGGELEGIPEDEEETSTPEENNKDEEEIEGIDTVDYSFNGENDSDESPLIKNDIGEDVNENVETKLNFLKRIGSFSFLRKNDAVTLENNSIEEAIDEEKTDNALPSYTEAVGELEEKESIETKSEDLDVDSASNVLQNGDKELDNKTIENDVKSNVFKPISTNVSQENETLESTETDQLQGKETNEVTSGRSEADETVKEEKKFRFRFQFFMDKK